MTDKYKINTEENRRWLSELQEELLTFGEHFPSASGASYYLGDDGTPWTERPRETWITCRMAHSYCLGAFLGHEGSEKLVDQALHGIRTELHDDVNGGWYPGVRADGTYLADKQCYAHAFVILAASSSVLAGREGSLELLREAQETFMKRFWDEERGLTYDTWNTEFTVCEPYRGINANMHTVESFLAAADATGELIWRERAGRVIAHVLEWAEDNDWRIPEHYSEDWVPQPEYNADKKDDPFKPYGATPGHGIEWSRLITQWTLATFRDDPEQAKPYIEKAEKLYRRAIEDGWCADGEPGIVYTTDWEGKPVVHDRMHWTLAEAINTSAVLYRVTGKEEYSRDYEMYMEYLDKTVHDPVNGSWYHQLDEKNQLKETVWPGKSDLYHALQSTLIPKYDPAVSIAAAVKYNKR